MLNKKIEIGSNYLIQEITDFTNLELENFSSNNQIKINIYIENMEKLEQFNASNIWSLYNLHVNLVCTKQIFNLLELKKLTANSIIKSILIEEKKYHINFFITDELPSFIINNNLKIIERLDVVDEEIYIHSKKYEILYQATSLLKELRKSNKKFSIIQSKLNDINSYISD